MSAGSHDAAPHAAIVRDDDEDDHARYLVRNPLRVHQLLRQLVEQRALLNAHIGGRDQGFPSAVLEIDEAQGQLLLDGSPHEATNRAAEQAGYLLCLARLDRVLVRFHVHHLRRERNGRHLAFRAPLPDSIVHLQRRELYRLETPVTASPLLLLPAADGRVATLAMRVVDISGGGLAITTPAACPVFGMQKHYEAELSLPDGPDLRVGLVACNQHIQTLPNGTQVNRVGLRFEHLPRGGDRAIQRYILRIDRQRSARRNGDG
ncbi:flagellar brake protein [Stenotrophomonas tumulicola]|uniref:Flagellar brake protein YcgR n=1 Tax=Stenotrophomonas tumulicola TaxID=1685415 RepID=A0A7W3FKM6_9GAMM|nr:flagellar brake protein [Stenotrophomonas tumulicola]MBA8681254.1 flagellar brake protein [Stenotrophomonas tumulicola]